MKVTKKDLVKSMLKDNSLGINKEDIEEVCDIFFTSIAEELNKNNRIELRGFGSFAIRNKLVPLDPRPNQNESKARRSHKSVYFRTAKALNDKMNIE